MEIRLKNRFVKKFSQSLIINKRNPEQFLSFHGGKTIQSSNRLKNKTKSQKNKEIDSSTQKCKKEDRMRLIGINVSEMDSEQRSERLSTSSRNVLILPQLCVSSYSTFHLNIELRQKAKRIAPKSCQISAVLEYLKDERFSTEESNRSDLTENINGKKNKFSLRTNLKRSMKHCF